MNKKAFQRLNCSFSSIIPFFDSLAKLNETVFGPEAILAGSLTIADEADVAAVPGREHDDSWIRADGRVAQRVERDKRIIFGVDDERRNLYARKKRERTGTL
ncbi:MAG: hypothetical protein ABR577_19940, partial [Pyrinomonadaceae bacterium]